MSKHISPSFMYQFPSGQRIHPCRLIHKDGTLMWKHALLYENILHLPQTPAQESHIQKTAQRLEELNSWVSKDLEPWECFQPIAWFVPHIEELNQGISVYFKHALYSSQEVYTQLLPHIQDYEALELHTNCLYFKRC